MKREIIYGDGNTFVHMAYMGEFWKNYVQEIAEFFEEQEDAIKSMEKYFDILLDNHVKEISFESPHDGWTFIEGRSHREVIRNFYDSVEPTEIRKATFAIMQLFHRSCRYSTGVNKLNIFDKETLNAFSKYKKTKVELDFVRGVSRIVFRIK